MTLGSFSNNGLAFGVAFTLHDAFSQSAAGIQQSMNRLTGATQSLQDRVSTELGRMTTGVALFGAALAVLVPIGWGLEQAGIMEQVRVSFNTLLRDTTLASSLIKDLRFFADWTPFETMETLKAGKALLAYGVQASNVIPTLTSLGNIASGLNLNLDDLVTVYGRNLTQPFIFSRDIYQFASRGLPIVEALAKVLGTAKENVLDMAANRGIRPDDMVKAIDMIGRGTDGFGKSFEGMMRAQSQTYKGLMSTITSYMQQAAEAVGNQFLPLMKEVMRVGIALFKLVAAFANSPIGSWVITLIGSVAALTAALGLMAVVMGGARLVGLQMVWMFSAATREAILLTIAEHGLAAGMRSMAVATWTALAPILAWLAPLALLGYIIYRSVNAFNDMKAGFWGLTPHARGLEGIFQRLGGYIMGFFQILSSWNGKTFEFGQDMAIKLDALGILQNVVAIGTWLVRIKTFLGGIWDGFSAAVDVIWREFTSTLDGIFNLLESMGFEIDRAGGKLEMWATVGRYVGYALAGIAVVLAMIGAGIAVVVAGVVLALGGLMRFFGGLWTIFATIWEFLGKVVQRLGDFSGINWVINKIWGADETAGGGSSDMSQGRVLPGGPSYFNDLGFQAAGYQGQTAAPQRQGPFTPPPPVVVPAPAVTNIITLDGTELFKKMEEKRELEDARQ